MVISLFAESQKKAIVDDIPCISSKIIIDVFESLFSNVSSYVKPTPKSKKVPMAFGDSSINNDYQKEYLFDAASKISKRDISKALQMLINKIEVEYVQL